MRRNVIQPPAGIVANVMGKNAGVGKNMGCSSFRKTRVSASGSLASYVATSSFTIFKMVIPPFSERSACRAGVERSRLVASQSLMWCLFCRLVVRHKRIFCQVRHFVSVAKWQVACISQMQQH